MKSYKQYLESSYSLREMRIDEEVDIQELPSRSKVIAFGKDTKWDVSHPYAQGGEMYRQYAGTGKFHGVTDKKSGDRFLVHVANDGKHTVADTRDRVISHEDFMKKYPSTSSLFSGKSLKESDDESLPTQYPAGHQQFKDHIVNNIAKQHLGIPTLNPRHRDKFDFHNVHVSGIHAALQAAFDAGVKHQLAK